MFQGLAPNTLQYGIRGGLTKMNFSINLLFMLNRVSRLRIFLREVSKLFKSYVLAKNFDQKPAISLKTLKIGFFNTLL